MISLSEAPFTPNVEPHELDPNYLITQIKFRLMSSGIMDDNHIKAYIYFYLFSHFVDKENAKNIDIPEDLLVTHDSKRLRKNMLNYDNEHLFPYFEKIFFPNLPKYKIEKNVNNDIMCYLKGINENNLSIDILRNESKMFNNSTCDNIIKLCSPTKNDTFCDPFMGKGYILYRYLKHQKDYINDNINGYESDANLLGTGRVLLFLQTFKFLENIYKSNPLIDNFNHKGYDVIITRLPNNIHGITHAETCERVKELKIRGTKFIPLALQLIMKSLNKNGRACVVIPNSLLQSTSICAVETRKYLLNNFEVEKIIDFPNEESAIYFKNSGNPTTSIEYNFNFERFLYTLDMKDINENYILIKRESTVKSKVAEVVEKIVPVKLDKNEQIIELLKEIRDLLKK